MSIRNKTLEEEVIRAKKAEMIMKEPLVQEALSTIRAMYFDAWRSSGSSDTAEREKFHAMFQVVDEFEGHLSDVMKSGQMAERELTSKY
jgi:hypothetical protein